jgi:uncharacterized protein YbbK (DUF523 family)
VILDEFAIEDGAPYLVSACLLGIPTRWDGHHCLAEELLSLAADGRVLAFCAEVTGGLSIPRGDASIHAYDGDKVLFKQVSTVDGHDVLDGRARVVTKEGIDVTAEYVRGAERGLELVKRYGVTTAILKAHSPSCGSREIYDGTFTLTLKPGQGVLAALLSRDGVTVYSENDLIDLLGPRT